MDRGHFLVCSLFLTYLHFLASLTLQHNEFHSAVTQCVKNTSFVCLKKSRLVISLSSGSFIVPYSLSPNQYLRHCTPTNYLLGATLWLRVGTSHNAGLQRGRSYARASPEQVLSQELQLEGGSAAPPAKGDSKATSQALPGTSQQSEMQSFPDQLLIDNTYSKTQEIHATNACICGRCNKYNFLKKDQKIPLATKYVWNIRLGKLTIKASVCRNTHKFLSFLQN